MAQAFVSVVKGDIVRQPDCDGVVNAANAQLLRGSGVCGAIYRAAGRELDEYTSRLGPVPVGGAVATPAFMLPCRHIIHAVGPRYLQDADPPGKLAGSLRRAIELADGLGIARLAVPAISTGIYGYPPREAVPILVGVAAGMTATVQNLVEIRFVVVADDLLDLFQSAIALTG